MRDGGISLTDTIGDDAAADKIKDTEDLVDDINRLAP